MDTVSRTGRSLRWASEDANVRRRRSRVSLHPGINLSPLRVDGNAAGLFFAAATVAILALGLRPVALLFAIGLIAGIGVAGLLRWWHTHRSGDSGLEPLGLKVKAGPPADSPHRQRRAA